MSEKLTMMDYVKESSRLIGDNVKRSYDLTKQLVDLYVEREYKTIWIVASGSSYNGSYCARMFMRHYLQTEVKIVTPYTFVNYENDVDESDFVFVVSQSGCSTNAIDALKRLKQTGKLGIGLTGNLNSDFKDVTDVLIEYGVGVETVGYVTKGVTTLAEYLMLFSIESALRKKSMTLEEAEALKQEITQTAKINHEVMINTISLFEKNIKTFTSMTNAYTMGCGANFGTVLEGALKIGETVQVPSVAYELEEFIHGPNLQITPNYTLFFIDGNDISSHRIAEIYHASRAVTDRVFVLSNNPEIDDEHAVRYTGTVSELLSPLAFLPFFQVIAFLATDKLRIWLKHPLFAEFQNRVDAKSASYVHSET